MNFRPERPGHPDRHRYTALTGRHVFDLSEFPSNLSALDAFLQVGTTGSGGAEPAFAEAVSFFDGTPGQENLLFTVTDDVFDIDQLGDEIAQLDTSGVVRGALGFGNDINTAELETFLGALVDEAVGHPLLEVADPTDTSVVLPSLLARAQEALPGSPIETVVDFTLTLNGVDTFDFDDMQLVTRGELLLSAEIFGLDNTPGATNGVTATAFLDTDGDGLADNELTAETSIDAFNGFFG